MEATFRVRSEELNRTLSQYQLWSKKALSEVLDQKGNDLRIKLYESFFAKRFGAIGKRKKEKGIALRQMMERGGKIRIADDTKMSRKTRDKRGRRLSEYQRKVAGELARRERGIGVLGVTFLWKRWRRKGMPDAYLATNVIRGGTVAMRIEKSPTRFYLIGFTEALSKISARYGILTNAMAAVTADMRTYIDRKMREAGRKARISFSY